jgi:4-diphosphocytidyl-2C-methyl-D-erythritol kinase
MARPTAPSAAHSLRLPAPAKINLHLRVRKRRGDGFHPLLTWMCTVGLFDMLTLEATGPTATTRAAATPGDAAARPAPPRATGRAGEPAGADVPDLRFDCDQPGLPRDEGNLVVRIAKAFAAELLAPPPPGGGGFPAGGATGSWARVEGGGGASGSAGAAQDGSSGKGGAGRTGRAHSDPGGMFGNTDAAREAERPVGKDDGVASPSPGRGHSRGRQADAPAAPAAPGPAGAEINRAQVGASPVGITLAKRVPVGAGLGGGSSDAAFTLVGLNRLWGAGWAADRLSEFAARFGSDVPFFVAAAFDAPSAACLGRGEIVRPVPRPAPRWALLVLPPFPLSTRDVYARFDEMGLGFDWEVSEGPDWRAWAALESRDLLPRLVNDLESAAFALSPELAALRAAVKRTAGRVVRMSGSGSSLFTLFDADETDAARATAGDVSRRHGVRVELAELCPALADDGVSQSV